VLVGEVAKRQAVTNVDRTIRSVKRHMGTDWKSRCIDRSSRKRGSAATAKGNISPIVNTVNSTSRPRKANRAKEKAASADTATTSTVVATAIRVLLPTSRQNVPEPRMPV
ncbi:Hsp70 family protein, partial [Streptomyces sp. NPDC005921]